jgi:hypothetical protein
MSKLLNLSFGVVGGRVFFFERRLSDKLYLFEKITATPELTQTQVSKNK